MKLRTTLTGLLLLAASLACICGGEPVVEPVNPLPVNTIIPASPTSTATPLSPTPTLRPTSPPDLPAPTQIQPPPANTPLPPIDTPTPIPPAGWLTLEENLVEVGQTLNTLQQLIHDTPFFNGDLLRISNDGRVLMQIDTDLWVRLFRNTRLEVLHVEPADNVPLDIQVLLEEGNITGNLQVEDGQFLVKTLSNVTVTVLGTSFFISYDPASGETIVVNFDGTIIIDDGSGLLDLPPGYWVNFPSGVMEQFDPAVNLAALDSLLRQAGDPEHVNELLACPAFTDLSLDAVMVDDYTFDVTWSASGGCAPYTGTLTATYTDEDEPYAVYDIGSISGSLLDEPRLRCAGTFPLEYELRLVDALERELTAVISQKIFFLC